MYIWAYTGEVNAKRVRERYLQAVLRQDIAFFDNVGAGEVTTRIQTDTRRSRSYVSSIYSKPPFTDLIQQGTSEKVALILQYIAAFLCSYVLAYVRSWRLALALTSILPCIAITGRLMLGTSSKYLQ